MRLLFIRHAEPDYSTDTLTEKGRREAALLAKAVPSMQLDHCFVSPLGRAQETASFCMKTAGMTAKTLDWLEEFDAPVDLNRTPELLAAYPNVKPEPPAGVVRKTHSQKVKQRDSRRELFPKKRIFPKKEIFPEMEKSIPQAYIACAGPGISGRFTTQVIRNSWIPSDGVNPKSI